MAMRSVRRPAPGSRYNRSSTGGGSGAMDFSGILSKIAETLAPGGTAEQTQIGQINKEAGMLANRMEGANISRGLGNATMGVEATVGAQAADARGAARSNVLGQYINALQFLADASLRQQGLDIQATQATGPTNAQRGLDAFGRPMRGTLAATEQALAEASLRQAVSPESVAPNPAQLPSLYRGGGAGLDLDWGSNPFASTPSQPASTYDPWGPLKGYGELASGESVGQAPPQPADIRRFLP